MKFAIAYVIALLTLCGDVVAQDDSATQYIHGLPVTEDDTVHNFPANDLEPRNQAVVVPRDRLPGELLKTLNEKSEYKGWEKLPVVKNINTGIYTIRIVHKEDTTYLGMNENGQVVTYGRNSVDDQ